MTELKTNGPGQVRIADEALAVIARTAALEASGVAGLAGSFTNEIVEILGRKQAAKGVAVSVECDSVTVSADIAVCHGVKIQEVSADVQQRIKTAVETMTGLDVREVNVNVIAQISEKPQKNI